MEIARKIQGKSTVLIAAITLVVIGFSLVLFTWQIMRQQKEASEQHLLLGAMSVSEMVESFLRRNHMREGSTDFTQGAADFFRELEESGGVAFVGILRDKSGRIISSSSAVGSSFELSADAIKIMQESGEWHGEVQHRGKNIYIYGRRVTLRERLAEPSSAPRNGPWNAGEDSGRIPVEDKELAKESPPPVQLGPEQGVMTWIPSFNNPQESDNRKYTGNNFKGNMPDRMGMPGMPPMRGMMGMHGGMHNMRPVLKLVPAYLIIGLDAEKHQNIYAGFKKNALFQTIYILIAAVFIWGLSMSLISRRDLAGKAVELERFQADLLDNLPDGLLTVGEDNIIQAANPAVHRIFGLEPASGKNNPGQMVGKSIDILPSAVFACIENPSKSKGKGLKKNWHKVSILGAQLEILCSPLQTESGGSIVLVRDRTLVDTLEKNLAEAEKLAAVGTLAAGVAHEIRNPLSALRGFAQYFAKKLSGQQPEEEYARTMVKEADRLNQVITDLLYLSRPKNLELANIDLKKAIDEVASLLRLDMEGLEVKLDLDLGAAQIWADEKCLKQSLLNLLLNSLDAFRGLPLAEGNGDSGKGKFIRISSRQVPADAAGAFSTGSTWLELRDNGPGLSPEQLAQAFEPFFTSKDKGTGLGLALVHKTMREHGGEAYIYSGSTPVSIFGPAVQLLENVEETEKAKSAERPGCSVWLVFPNEV